MSSLVRAVVALYQDDSTVTTYLAVALAVVGAAVVYYSATSEIQSATTHRRR
jgi:hypothetical protein